MVQYVQIVPSGGAPPRPEDPKLREEWVKKWCFQTVKQATESYYRTCALFKTDDPTFDSVKRALNELEDAKLRARLVKTGQVAPLEEDRQEQIPEWKKKRVREKYEKKLRVARAVRPRSSFARLVRGLIILLVLAGVLGSVLTHVGVLELNGVGPIDTIVRAARNALAGEQLTGVRPPITAPALPPRGFRMGEIPAGSLGSAIGLHAGDVITRIDGQPIVNLDDLIRAEKTAPAVYDIEAFRADHPITLRVDRTRHNHP